MIGMRAKMIAATTRAIHGRIRAVSGTCLRESTLSCTL
jgi:hypothetical protein